LFIVFFISHGSSFIPLLFSSLVYCFLRLSRLFFHSAIVLLLFIVFFISHGSSFIHLSRLFFHGSSFIVLPFSHRLYPIHCLVLATDIPQKLTAQLTAGTERSLANKAGHLELLAGGKKDKNKPAAEGRGKG
jgi:Protein of unknown function (DUF2462)